MESILTRNQSIPGGSLVGDGDSESNCWPNPDTVDDDFWCGTYKTLCEHNNGYWFHQVPSGWENKMGLILAIISLEISFSFFQWSFFLRSEKKWNSRFFVIPYEQAGVQRKNLGVKKTVVPQVRWSSLILADVVGLMPEGIPKQNASSWHRSLQPRM